MRIHVVQQAITGITSGLLPKQEMASKRIYSKANIVLHLCNIIPTSNLVLEAFHGRQGLPVGLSKDNEFKVYIHRVRNLGFHRAHQPGA